jgi:nucleotide-binding universal stress UspA family protein
MSHTTLCLVDDSPELRAAIRYTARLAKQTGNDVGLLYVIPTLDFQQWGAVESLVKSEGRAEAERILQRWALTVEGLTGIRPFFYIREGTPQQALFALLDEEQDIDHLVLAASEQAGNPGELVSVLGGKLAGQLRLPLTIIPGRLSDEDIDGLFR